MTLTQINSKLSILNFFQSLTLFDRGILTFFKFFPSNPRFPGHRPVLPPFPLRLFHPPPRHAFGGILSSVATDRSRRHRIAIASMEDGAATARGQHGAQRQREYKEDRALRHVRRGLNGRTNDHFYRNTA